MIVVDTLDAIRIHEVVLAGPAGDGNSVACLQHLHRLALTFPGMRGLIVRKTRWPLNENALFDYEEKVLSESERRQIAAGVNRRSRRSYVYPNGSEIVVGSLEHPTKFAMAVFDTIYAQQATEFTEDDWELLASRLRHGVAPRQQIIGDAGRIEADHWLGQRAGDGKLLIVQTRLTEDREREAAEKVEAE